MQTVVRPQNPQVEVTHPGQKPHRPRLTAKWLKDGNGKLYCKWITD